MICTVTFNPSLDYVVQVPDFQPGRTNRTAAEALYPGGKGVNVSIVLQHLGVPSRALGFSAGFTGQEIARRLEELAVETEFIPLAEGCSRINVKLQNIEGTEINGMGPAIPAEKTRDLLHRLDRLERGDVLILAGSIPASMPPDIYRTILERLAGRGVLTVVDAARDLLTNVLPLRPFLVKPNAQELGELFGVKLHDRASVVPYAQKLQAMGAQNVLVSLAGQGAVLAAADGRVWSAPAPEGRLVNGVGAGDSMVAGFVAGWLERQDYGYAFRLGVAAGSATAFAPHLASGEAILKLYEAVTLECPQG